MDKKAIGIIIFIILIVIIAGIYMVGPLLSNNGEKGDVYTINHSNYKNNIEYKDITTVYVAAGGGKEGFLADEEIHKILIDKYKLNVVYDNWSNGKLVLWPLVREAVGNGNASETGTTGLTISTPGTTPYDAMFSSDFRYYDYYQKSADKTKGEADRYRMQGGSQTLNTPIVVYSWDDVTDVLIKENIVTLKNGTYYITDMHKLLDYMSQKKTWAEIGLDKYFGPIEIKSVDPVESSPGATYYGLLLSIFCNGIVTDETAIENLPSLKEFYTKAGALPHAPADLFKSYCFQGLPLIVDYEKSIVDLANSDPASFNEIKDRIRILYPEPTMWNAHCYQYFTDAGKQLFDAFSDEQIQQIAWNKYGFRLGMSNNTEELGIGIPKTITQTVQGLRMELYDKMHDYLAEKDEEKAYNILHDIAE